jgi:hypothetical protein
MAARDPAARMRQSRALLIGGLGALVAELRLLAGDVAIGELDGDRMEAERLGLLRAARLQRPAWTWSTRLDRDAVFA